jgi:serine/alanine adding enzyme
MKWAIPVFQKHDFVYEAHLNILIDLHQPKEVMLKNISRNKKRNVTKSINKGSEVEIIQTKEVYLQSLDLIYTTYNRIGLPLVARSYFIQAFEQLHPQGILKPFALFKDGQCIGVRLELVYEGVIYDWFAGSSDQYKNHYPNDVLPYSILDWGSDKKCSEFNFGGAGKPDVEYGVREHKLKFGGELVEFGRFEKVNNRFLFQIGKMGLNLVKKIKNKR